MRSRSIATWLRPALLLGAVATFASCEEKAAEPVAQTSSHELNNNYELGAVVRFGAGGGSERFRVSGWSDTEKQFTWSTGNSAKLALSVGKSDQSMDLRMRLASLIKQPELPSQPVEVWANGLKIADWDVSMPADFSTVIPAGTIKDDGLLTIELKTPKATSPQFLGLSEDPRVLGVLCSELAITKTG